MLWLLLVLCQLILSEGIFDDSRQHVVVLWTSDWRDDALEWFGSQWVQISSDQSLANVMFIPVSVGTNVSKTLPSLPYATTGGQVRAQLSSSIAPVDGRNIFTLINKDIRNPAPNFIMLLVGSTFSLTDLTNVPTNLFVVMPAPRQMQTAIDIVGPAKALLELPTIRMMVSRNITITNCSNVGADLYCSNDVPSKCISTPQDKCYTTPNCSLLYYQCVNKLPSCQFSSQQTCEAEQSCYWDIKSHSCMEYPIPPPTSAPRGTWDFNLLKRGVDCEAAEVNLTSNAKSPSPEDCAIRCSKTAGCRFFIYSNALGQCLWVKTETAACKEGLLQSDFDYYEMKLGLPYYEDKDDTKMIVCISAGCLLFTIILALIIFRGQIKLRYYNWKREQQYWDAVLLDNPFVSQLPQDRQVEASDLMHMREIGNGNFGMVYKAMFSVTKESVAVKELRYSEDAEKMFEFCKEITNLASLTHQNIITFYGWSFDKESERLFMITEFCEHGSLLDLTQKNMSHEERRGVAANLISIAQALAFIHDKDKAHMDVAARNILISRSGFLKLADFGLLTRVGRDVQQICYPWSPPETIETMTASTAHDVWSFGCLMFEVLTGKPPYSDRLDEVNQSGQVVKIKDLVMSGELLRYERSADTLTSRLWEEVAEQCWQAKDLRPTMSQIIEKMSQINAPITGLISVFNSEFGSALSSGSPRSAVEYNYNVPSHQLSYLCYHYSPIS